MTKRFNDEEIKKYISENADGYLLHGINIANWRTRISVQCDKNHPTYEVDFQNFKAGKRCPYCFGTPKHSYEYIKHYIEVESGSGYKLLSKEYARNNENLSIQCNKGHIYSGDFTHFKYSNCRCPVCFEERKHGVTHWNWNGGITPLHNYLRQCINEWKKQCLKQNNYTCCLSNEVGHNLVVHHLEPFSIILKRTLKELDIPVYKEISMYSKEQLDLITQRIIENHPLTNGVPLKKEIHSLFHKLYGKGKTTPEQFEEFKQCYYSGEFKGVI